MVTRLMILALVVMAATSSQDAAWAQNPKSLHEAGTLASWQSFEKGDFSEAIKQADKVIDEFGPMARRLESDVAAAKHDPPVGKIPKELQEPVFKRGPLNDVAACWFVKARALYKSGKTEESKQAFAAAAKLPSARIYDPKQDLFWSPAAISRRAAQDPSLSDKAPHEIYTADAWAALNGGQYANAAKHADECLSQFISLAETYQVELTKGNIDPPVGAVTDLQKQAVFKNGLLNDVCTCAFIKGKALEEMRDRPAAIKAYGIATKLSHGRCWDPQGWFWSPAVAASDRIDVLK